MPLSDEHNRQTMEKTYDPREIEQRLYQRWEAHGWFAPSGSGQPYSIVIPYMEIGRASCRERV